MNVIEACQDPQLFGHAFQPWSDWAPWEVALRAAFALPVVRYRLEY